MTTATKQILSSPMPATNQQAMDSQIERLSTSYNVMHGVCGEQRLLDLLNYHREILEMIYRGYSRQIIFAARAIDYKNFCVALAIDICISKPGFVATIHDENEESLSTTFTETVQYIVDNSQYVRDNVEPAQAANDTLEFKNGSRIQGAITGSEEITDFNIIIEATYTAKYHKDKFARTLDAVKRSPQEYIAIIDAYPSDDGGKNEVTRTAREMCDRDKAGQLTPENFWVNFVAWWRAPYNKRKPSASVMSEISPQLEEYFAKIEQQEGIKLSLEQKYWYTVEHRNNRAIADTSKLLPSTLNEALYPNRHFLKPATRH